MPDKIKILFLCTGNSCRSQMAEGLANHFFKDKIEAYSAGTKPSPVNPYAIKVMTEIGIDISMQRSKNVSEFAGQDFDYVITLCDSARQSCPFFPGKAEYIHWDLADPALAQGNEEEILRVFSITRNKIKNNLSELVNKQ